MLLNRWSNIKVHYHYYPDNLLHSNSIIHQRKDRFSVYYSPCSKVIGLKSYIQGRDPICAKQRRSQGGSRGGHCPPKPTPKFFFFFFFLILSFLFSVSKVRTVVFFFFLFNWLVLVADEVVKNEIYVYIFYTCFPNH